MKDRFDNNSTIFFGTAHIMKPKTKKCRRTQPDSKTLSKGGGATEKPYFVHLCHHQLHIFLLRWARGSTANNN